MRLLRGDKMTASGGERVGPPMPGGDKQQDGNKNRVRGKKKRYLAVGETKRPRDSRRQIVASGTGQNPEHRAEKEPCSFLPPSAGAGIPVRDSLLFDVLRESYGTSEDQPEQNRIWKTEGSSADVAERHAIALGRIERHLE